MGIVGFSGQGSPASSTSRTPFSRAARLRSRADRPEREGLPGTAADVVAAHQGTSLVLSLDEPLQFEVTKDLTHRSRPPMPPVAVMVEDSRTGDILAMVDLVEGPTARSSPRTRTSRSPPSTNPARS